jgi:hypothetical protein
MTEDQLLEAIREYALLKKWLCYHTHDSRKSEPGFPDLVLLRSGWIIFAELKKEGEHPSLEQEKWLRQLDKLVNAFNESVGVYVWYPSDWRSGRIEEILK